MLNILALVSVTTILFKDCLHKRLNDFYFGILNDLSRASMNKSSALMIYAPHAYPFLSNFVFGTLRFY